MGVRQWLNDRSGATIWLAAAILLAGVALLFFQISNAKPRPIGNLAWFTVDDGKTWFAESAMNLPPFEYKGKTAYRCYVFACKDGSEFVSHLERLPPELKKRLDSGVGFDPMSVVSVEVKDPLSGEQAWVPQASQKGSEIMTPTCPDHPGELGTPVHP